MSMLIRFGVRARSHYVDKKKAILRLCAMPVCCIAAQDEPSKPQIANNRANMWFWGRFCAQKNTHNMHTYTKKANNEKHYNFVHMKCINANRNRQRIVVSVVSELYVPKWEAKKKLNKWSNEQTINWIHKAQMTLLHFILHINIVRKKKNKRRIEFKSPDESSESTTLRNDFDALNFDANGCFFRRTIAAT